MNFIDRTVLPATHTQTIPAFTPQPQGITAIWLVLIAPTHEGMARLSCKFTVICKHLMIETCNLPSCPNCPVLRCRVGLSSHWS